MNGFNVISVIKLMDALLKLNNMKTILTNKPKGWRDGQTIFNFLEWLGKKNYAPRTNTERLSDTFYGSDELLASLYQEFLDEHSV